MIFLPTSCVSVTVNGTVVPAEYVEGKRDGYLYIFLKDDFELMAEDKVSISFTPADDCPILYTNARRPSTDIESEMKVLGFTNETAYFDTTVWSASRWQT